MKLSRLVAPALAALVVAAPAVAAAGLLAGRRPEGLGAPGGRLSPCRTSPNCVCSQAADAAHFIEPLPFPPSATGAMAALRRVVESMERTRIVRADEGYLYAEFASRLLGFVDDVEFALDPAARVIHVRSASRLGSRDFGVNRRRIEEIRARLAAAGG